MLRSPQPDASPLAVFGIISILIRHAGFNMRDNIFATKQERVGDFVFDETVASVFPDMIRRSVPGYPSIVSAVGMLTRRYAQENTCLYDLGSSLGACAMEMAGNAPDNTRVIGIDCSAAMVQRSREIISSCKYRVPVEIIQDDIASCSLEPASVVVMNFVLQFIAPEQRLPLLEKISRSLVPGGVLVLSEKFSFTDSFMMQALTDLHLDFKKANGYSDLEISQKRASLENVMITESPAKRLRDLELSGFSHAGLWFQCFNFGSILAVKE